MTSINVSLPEGLKEYVEHRVSRGGYGTTSEYLRELIRADMKRAAEDRLEDLLLEGLQSGEPVEVTPQFWTDLWERVDERKKRRHAETCSK
jgi:antitoxin ParD1/3/4